MFKRARFSLFLALLLVLALVVSSVGCGAGEEAETKGTIMFSDLGWDSALANNRIAQFIIEHGYGYQTDAIPGETIALLLGLRQGDIDVTMEIWVENQQEAYDQALAAGEVVDLGTNFDDNVQGMFVPTYVIAGDPERGIEPMAPSLRTVADLPKYWEVFKDPEDPTKGRFYGGVPGWEADKIMGTKFETYGLNETYNIFRPGSSAALAASLVTAYEKGEPWFGYYWSPTWISGKLDLTLIEEPPFSEELWAQGYACAFSAVNVNIAVHQDLPERAPEVVEFLRNYRTNSALISEMLAYMEENETDHEAAALWFLREQQAVWTQWVPEDVAAKVKAQL